MKWIDEMFASTEKDREPVAAKGAGRHQGRPDGGSEKAKPRRTERVERAACLDYE